MLPEEHSFKTIPSILFSYGIPLFLAIWGGTAGYLNKIKQGRCRFSISEWIGEICISGFVGVTVFIIATSYNCPAEIAACLAGISGHMGSRAIFVIETIIQIKAEKYLGISLEEEEEENLSSNSKKQNSNCPSYMSKAECQDCDVKGEN